MFLWRNGEGNGTYQATVSGITREIGLGSGWTLAHLRHFVGAVCCWWSAANAKDQTVGFDELGVEVWRFQYYQLDVLGLGRYGRS